MRIRRPGQILIAVAALTVMCLTVGCSGTCTVSGTVTQANGQPLSGGDITFVPVDTSKTPVTGVIKPDGTYQVSVPKGECKVAIDNRNVGKAPPPPVGAGGGYSGPDKSGAPKGGGPPMGKGGPPNPGDKIKEKMQEKGVSPTGSGQAQAGTYVKIDPKYHDHEKSGLVFTISGGSQKIDIKLD